MSDEQNLTKRERQKARRAAKLEREAQAEAAASRNRILTYGLVVVLVVALIGYFVYRQFQASAEEREQAERAEAKLEELGCTEDSRQPDLGGGHISGSAEALAAEAPAVIYPDQPPSSGRHIGQVVPSGVYDVRIDPRFTTHNMEHGYVLAWYGPDAPEEEVAELKSWAEDQVDGPHPKMVVAEYYEPLPDDANFAYTAWFFRQSCEEFDADVAEVFTRAHYDTAGEGPEKGIPSHNVGAQGVIDPEGEDLFLPPLDAEFGTSSPLEEVEDAGPASDTDPDDQATESDATEAAPDAATESDAATEPAEAATE